MAVIPVMNTCDVNSELEQQIPLSGPTPGLVSLISHSQKQRERNSTFTTTERHIWWAYQVQLGPSIGFVFRWTDLIDSYFINSHILIVTQNMKSAI